MIKDKTPAISEWKTRNLDKVVIERGVGCDQGFVGPCRFVKKPLKQGAYNPNQFFLWCIPVVNGIEYRYGREHSKTLHLRERL